ncbi:hypothetical protein GG344DRAFT_67524 [Lentinula edodes]|nr:hypothetical protein GG344DRAFT_67524 [Lentinula edodes]
MSASTGEAELRQNSNSENSGTSPEHQSSPKSWTLGDRTSNDHLRAKSIHQTASEEPEGHDRSDKDSLQGSTEKSKPKDKVKANATAETFKGKEKAIEKEKVTSPQKKPMLNRRSSTRLQTNDNSSLSILSDDDDPSLPSSECLPDDQAAIADALKVQILGKKRSMAVVASALNRNTLALGGHQLELIEIQRKNEERVRGEIGELRVRVDALEVSGLGALVDESVISDGSASPKVPTASLLRDIRTRIKSLEGNVHSLKDGVDWKKTLDKELRRLKDKVEIYEDFSKTLPKPKDVMEVRTYATKEVTRLGSLISKGISDLREEVRVDRKTSIADTFKKVTTTINSHNDTLREENRKLWAKLDDVSTKLEAALADNDGLRARLQALELGSHQHQPHTSRSSSPVQTAPNRHLSRSYSHPTHSRSRSSSPASHSHNQRTMPPPPLPPSHRHSGLMPPPSPRQHSPPSLPPLSRRRSSPQLPPLPIPPQSTSRYQEKRGHSPEMESRSRKGQKASEHQSVQDARFRITIGPFPDYFYTARAPAVVRRYFEDVVQPLHCPYVRESTVAGVYVLVFSNRQEADEFVEKWIYQFPSSQLGVYKGINIQSGGDF